MIINRSLRVLAACFIYFSTPFAAALEIDISSARIQTTGSDSFSINGLSAPNLGSWIVTFKWDPIRMVFVPQALAPISTTPSRQCSFTTADDGSSLAVNPGNNSARFDFELDKTNRTLKIRVVVQSGFYEFNYSRMRLEQGSLSIGTSTQDFAVGPDVAKFNGLDLGLTILTYPNYRDFSISQIPSSFDLNQPITIKYLNWLTNTVTVTC